MLLSWKIASQCVSYWITEALEMKGSWLPLPKWTPQYCVENILMVCSRFLLIFQESRIQFQLQIDCCVKGRKENSLLAEFHLGNCFVLLDFTLVLYLYCMQYLKALSYPTEVCAVLHYILLKRSNVFFSDLETQCAFDAAVSRTVVDR